MYVAIMGYGVVGSGVASLLEKNHEHIVKKSMQSEMELKYILDRRTFPGDPYEHLVISDFSKILEDDGVKIVVETMGGVHPAYEYVSACLNAGKSVVTSNKELVATKGCELLRIADEKNVNFLFEASVGGGIPIIRPISQCLAANDIDEIAGILNGTTNFILTKMISDGMTFEDALFLAQKNGYAERDPSADVDGFDACRKICILAALCFGKHVYPACVHTEGIRKITLADVEYARSWGGVIKLIASAKKLDNGKVSVMVSPAFIQNHSQLATVDDVFNAILVRGDAIGDVVFYGKGAGKMPTASAVVADVIDCAKHMERKKFFGWQDSEPGYVADYLDNITSFYIRGTTQNAAAAIARINSLFGDVQMLTRANAPEGEFAFATDPLSERELDKKLALIEEAEIASVIRITDY
ncbi:MAG: homoserine dehydrogenase [Oscillospiraceae bacterium]|nr:homoserine dehydrogenase [Clostridiaceae bacterium]MDY5948766.1 homoserine dehydrogenase [Oscillospiraceae bacterium]